MFTKRVHSSPKKGIINRSAKGKDISTKTTNCRYNKISQPLDMFENEPKSPTFPHVKLAENSEILPCYAAVLARTSEEGVCMKDLDQLQQELEKLLSICAVRNHSLHSELELIDRVEERHEKKGKTFDRPSSPKIRKIEEKTKFVKESKPAYKLLKSFHDEMPKLEVPKITVPRNDTKSKFWLSVDPFCAPVSRDDIAFLDEVIQECSADTELKPPDLGTHYSVNWSSELPNGKYQGGPASSRHTKSKLMPIAGDHFSKNSKSTFFNGDSYTTSLILPLASALLEENGMSKYPSTQDKLKDLGIRSFNNSGVCLDKRLRKELVDLGILDHVDDDPKSVQADDNEIMQEIKTCHVELVSVNDHNKRELNRLRNLVIKDMARQELSNKLDEVDNQVMEVYNKLLTCSPKDSFALQWDAVRIVRLQRKLHKEAMEMTDIRI